MDKRPVGSQHHPLEKRGLIADMPVPRGRCLVHNALRPQSAGMREICLRRAAAVVLIVAIAVSGTFILHKSSSSDQDVLTGAIKGEAASGWINDVEVYGGVANDAWPTIVSDGDSLCVAFSRFDSGTGYYRIIVMKSTDGGIAWSQIGDISPGPHDSVYPVMLAFYGELYVAFQYNVSSTDHDIYCYKSSVGTSGPWTSYGVRTDSNDDRRPAIGTITESNYIGVYVVFENHRGSPDGTDLLIYKSTGAAFSFVNTVVGDGDSGDFTMADVSVYQEVNNPMIYVGFERLSSGQRDIYFTRSSNGGTSWSSLYQATSNLNDEYAPSISVSLNYLLISYVMWDGEPDLYATIWNGAAFGTAAPLSSGAEYEGWPEVLNWLGDFYVVYARGSTYTDGSLFMQSASESLNPSWSYPSMISDNGAAADTGYRPGLALCDRPNGNLYFAAAWGDYRTGSGNSDIFYTTQGCRYTVLAAPPGPTFWVDDVMYSSEQTFNWPAGFQHTLTASTDVNTFLYWDDGTDILYTLTITPYALTNDVVMVASYVGIPEFSDLALPVIGMIGVFLLVRVRRRMKDGIP